MCASGGFEANIDWLRRYWGSAADNFLIRGPATNDGRMLAALYALGAAQAGQERGFHAVAIDARSPRFDGGIATRLDCIPFSIVVNSRGERFYDEGEELWPKRYAIWGRNIAGQPGQIAYSIWDAKVNRLFLPPMYGPAKAGSVAGVAAELGLDPDAVAATVAKYNESVVAGSFDPSRLDGCRTDGLTPPKSNWAQPIDTPPFYGIAMRAGHHVHVPWSAGHRGRAGADGGGRRVPQRVRRRGDHVGKHPVVGLSGRFRPDDRDRLGPDRRGGRRARGCLAMNRHGWHELTGRSLRRTAS